MIAKKISSLVIALLCFFPTISFTAENKQNRYSYIKHWFLSDANQFAIGFTKQKDDLENITEHKAALEKERDSYKNSWIPSLLKLVGTGFGIDAAKMFAYSIATQLPRTYGEPIVKAASYTTYLSYPVTYARNLITKPITSRATESLLSKWFNGSHFAGASSYETAITSIVSLLSFGTSLFSTAIGIYLFKKANSYQEKIEQLQAAIEVDENMHRALENLPADPS
jgi:hypothetical protein